jgi:protease-4
MLKYVEQADLLFTWSDQDVRWNDFNRWGLFLGLPTPNMGFGVIQNKDSLGKVWDYRLSAALGDRRASFGIGYGWSTGDTEAHGRTGVFTLGALMRPMKYLSYGLWGTLGTSGNAKEGVLDIAVRPLGTEMITLFGDYGIQHGQKLKEGPWSTGLVLEALPGVRLVGRYFDTHHLTFGLDFSLGRLGLTSQSRFDRDGDHAYNTYGLRAGSMDRNVFTSYTGHGSKYMKLDMKGPVRYQRFRWFDRSKTLSGLIDAIDEAKDDPSVSGIAISTSGMYLNLEMAWELREKLRDFKSAGKRIVVFVDDVGIPGYHFASVADRIVIDPTGGVTLLGYRLGRSYLKGTLEKLGLGFDEWRFFTYKSAYEGFSRESMSEPDREQLQEIADDLYAVSRAGICEGRGFDHAEFDKIVNTEVFFTAEEAVERGLADAIGRWDKVEEVIKQLEGEKKQITGPGGLAGYNLRDDYWGLRPKIAVIYALGVCAMDTGIKARSLSRVIEGAGNNPDIKAIVFRVDSPGGSGTASDLVAEAIEKAKKQKPVIISQGWVAASGGYWLSMYGDTIVAAPISITGSIGVIGGWVYNQGLKEKLGMSTDLVKVGDHADLGYGITLPFLGRIPDRNLSQEERAKIEHAIRDHYRFFTELVAKGRGMEVEDVDKVGQGRVWTGLDAKDIGLVDELGGLEMAIEIARESANVPADQEVDIVEMPEAPLFNSQMFMPRLFGIDVRQFQEDKVLAHLRFRIEHNGEPMPILPLDFVDYLGTENALGY